MSAYYNEYDPFAAAWLRELIKAGLIAPGDVDERSIKEVSGDDLRGYTQCHFFAGIGGWSYALRLAGWDDARPVWTGSCPCQPFSVAGAQAGFADDRHLWPDFHRLIREQGPGIVFGEQVAGAAGYRWWDQVAADMESDHYAAAATNLGAHSVGSPHIRQRLYWVAYTNRAGRLEFSERDSDQNEPGKPASFGHDVDGRGKNGGSQWADVEWIECRDGKARPVKPGVFPLAHGVPARVGRLRGYGNAIVPQVAAAFVRAGMMFERHASCG